MLGKMLREEGLILPGADGKTARLKRIGTTVGRYLTIPRAAIDGKDEVQQMRFTDVTGTDVPF